MKVLIADDGAGAHTMDRQAWAKVLGYSNHEVTYWNLQQKPAFDAFNESNPDLFYGQLYNLDRAAMKCLLARKGKTRVVLRAGNWGTITDTMDLKKYPVLVASEDDKKKADLLRKEDCLDFLHIHYHQKRIAETMGHWEKEGYKVVGLPNAADLFLYYRSHFQKEFETDISIVSGYWPYKAQNLNRYIFPLCSPVGKYRIRIYGKQHWPVGQYLGPIQPENEKLVYASTKINIDVGEPHGEMFGFDQTERLFKVACAGGFYLHGGYITTTHEDFFDKGVVMYGENPKDFEGRIEYWLKDDESRKKYAEMLHKEVIGYETYFDRVATMFNELSLEKEAEAILVHKEKYLTGN